MGHMPWVARLRPARASRVCFAPDKFFLLPVSALVQAMAAAKQRNFSHAEELMAEALAHSVVFLCAPALRLTVAGQNPKDNPLSEADAARQGLARYFRVFEATMVGWKPYEEAVRNVSVRFLPKEVCMCVRVLVSVSVCIVYAGVCGVCAHVMADCGRARQARVAER